MALKIHSLLSSSLSFSSHPLLLLPANLCKSSISKTLTLTLISRNGIVRSRPSKTSRRSSLPLISAALPPLDLNEENVRQVLLDARSEFVQIFDASVGITVHAEFQAFNLNEVLNVERTLGEAELAEVDGPFVKLSLRGRFWHKRATVLARLGNYLKSRIPEILEVEIEDEKQLDDSPENF